MEHIWSFVSCIRIAGQILGVTDTTMEYVPLKLNITMLHVTSYYLLPKIRYKKNGPGCSTWVWNMLSNFGGEKTYNTNAWKQG